MSDKKRQVLAFDFGGGSGRAILGSLVDGKIRMEEVHRFSNDPVILNDTMYWDTLRHFFEIKQGIVKAKQKGGFDSIGIDTWGVDFGLLDEHGALLESAVHYHFPVVFTGSEKTVASGKGRYTFIDAGSV